MPNLVEWSDAIVPAHEAHSSVKVFPVLEEMEIWFLYQLCSFPNLGCLPKLRELLIWRCESLAIFPWNWNEELGRVGKSEIEDERAASTHESCVVSSSSSSEGPSSSSSYLPSLRRVTLGHCDKFTAPFCSLKILAPLESLDIECSFSLWPKDLHHLINLRSLYLGGGGSHSEEEEEVDCFPFFPTYSISNVNVSVNVNVRGAPEEDLQYFPSLTKLTLRGLDLPNVTSLSDQIQYLTSLTALNIWYFDKLETLPEWLGNLTSLQFLRVWYCENLKQLPHSFQRLTNLRSLHIEESPKLKEACTQGSGSEWPKIAPLIPNLKVYI